MEPLWILGDKYTFLHVSPAYTLVLCECHQNSGPPPHIHTHEDESFFLLDGEVQFLLNTDTRTLRKNDFLFAPRGIPHTFKILSPTARFLMTASPGGFEQFFAKIGTPVANTTSDPTPIETSVAKIMQHAPTFGMKLLIP